MYIYTIYTSPLGFSSFYMCFGCREMHILCNIYIYIYTSPQASAVNSLIRVSRRAVCRPVRAHTHASTVKRGRTCVCALGHISSYHHQTSYIYAATYIMYMCIYRIPGGECGILESYICVSLVVRGLASHGRPETQNRTTHTFTHHICDVKSTQCIYMCIYHCACFGRYRYIMVIYCIYIQPRARGELALAPLKTGSGDTVTTHALRRVCDPSVPEEREKIYMIYVFHHRLYIILCHYRFCSSLRNGPCLVCRGASRWVAWTYICVMYICVGVCVIYMCLDVYICYIWGPVRTQSLPPL